VKGRKERRGRDPCPRLAWGLGAFEGKLFAQRRGETQEATIIIAGSDELQSAFRRGKNDGGISAKAGWRGEAQDVCARFGVVGAGEEAGEGRYGREEEIEMLEKLFLLIAEGVVTLTELSDFIVAE
jgi:hypothetical protein